MQYKYAPQRTIQQLLINYVEFQFIVATTYHIEDQLRHVVTNHRKPCSCYTYYEYRYNGTLQFPKHLA